MANIKGLITLAFMASIGLMFLILGCALPQYDNWWPFFVVVFYILSPVPSLMARRITDGTDGVNGCRDLAYFMTSGLVLSAFALPIILARSGIDGNAGVIHWGACGLVLTGNLFVFLTLFGFFVMADRDDVEYSMW